MDEEFLSYNKINYDEISFGEKIDKGNLIVYKGKYKNQDIAIKEYITEKYDTDSDDSDDYDPDDQDNYYLDDGLINELYIGSKVSSERLLNVLGYSHNKEKNKIYLIMEYINSCSLIKYIDESIFYKNVEYGYRLSEFKPTNPYTREYSKGEKWNYIMDNELKKSIAISMLKAVKSMWDNKILHGDLKTHNLSIHTKGDEKFIKVIDYGTCFYDHESVELTRVIGTNGYYAHEQKLNILNHYSDIYSVGIMIIEIWCGYIWDKGKTFNECRNEALKSLRLIKLDNPNLEKLIRKCINIDHKKRPDIYKLYKMFIELDEE